ncbi:MAG TPA: CPBP family intramembrane glutamic endopeptidase [Phycisphaerales bacterium]|nr:CPBP family intramembrane glutamic endopeptidase [Phycisphaerales bacterium]
MLRTVRDLDIQLRNWLVLAVCAISGSFMLGFKSQPLTQVISAQALADQSPQTAITSQPDSTDQPVTFDLSNLVFAAIGLVMLIWIIRARKHTLKHAAGGLAPCEAPIAFLLFLAVFFASAGAILVKQLLFGTESIAESQPETISLAEQDKIQLSMHLCQLPFMLFFAWLVHHPKAFLSPASRALSARRFSPPRTFKFGVLTLLCVLPVVILSQTVMELLWQVFGLGPVSRLAHETLKSLVEAPHDRWMALSMFLAAIIAPIFEETIYRGLLQGGLRRMGFTAWPAILFTSVVFTSAHITAIPPYALIAIFTLSLGFGWVFERTGRLVSSIIMHALFNVLNLVLALTLRG